MGRAPEPGPPGTRVVAVQELTDVLPTHVVVERDAVGHPAGALGSLGGDVVERGQETRRVQGLSRSRCFDVHVVSWGHTPEGQEISRP